MSELEEKVKELICVKCKKPECMVPFNEACDHRNRYVKSILALIPKYEMEVDCPECGGSGEYEDILVIINPCPTCKGTGKITKPVESGDVGRIV